MDNIESLMFKVKQKEVFLKYLPNSVPPVFSSLSLFPSHDENNASIACARPAQLQQLSHQGIAKMATLAMPVLLMFSIAQPAEAWEKKAKRNQNSEVGSLIPKLTRQPLVNHEIKPGDTLWELSQQYETSPEQIANYNGIHLQQILQVGQTLKIPVGQNGKHHQPKLPEQPLAGVGGAVSSQNSALEGDHTASQEKLGHAIPQVIGHQVSSSESNRLPVPKRKGSARTVGQNAGVMSEVPIKQFLADVEQLRANYEPETATENQYLPVKERRNANKTNQGKVFSPSSSSSSNPASPNSLATAPIKVEFYNNFLNPPIGERVSPELPPLSSPEQYLPNSPQKFDGYIWPAEGVFTSGYGMRWGRMHKGIDIAAPIGTPIVASAPGEVIVAGWNNGGYGNWVKLQHPDGSITLYAHNSKVLVQKGQEVDQGEPIAKMGSSGRSTGPHLHFEIQRPGKGAVNPIAYLPER